MGDDLKQHETIQHTKRERLKKVVNRLTALALGVGLMAGLAGDSAPIKQESESISVASTASPPFVEGYNQLWGPLAETDAAMRQDWQEYLSVAPGNFDPYDYSDGAVAGVLVINHTGARDMQWLKDLNAQYDDYYQNELHQPRPTELSTVAYPFIAVDDPLASGITEYLNQGMIFHNKNADADDRVIAGQLHNVEDFTARSSVNGVEYANGGNASAMTVPGDEVILYTPSQRNYILDVRKWVVVDVQILSLDDAHKGLYASYESKIENGKEIFSQVIRWTTCQPPGEDSQRALISAIPVDAFRMPSYVGLEQ